MGQDETTFFYLFGIGDMKILPGTAKNQRVLRSWIKTEDYWTVKGDVTRGIHRVRNRLTRLRGNSKRIRIRLVLKNWWRLTASIIPVHNLPSGNTEPSKEDLAITERLMGTGELLGITIHDNIIVSKNRYTSMKERGSWSG